LLRKCFLEPFSERQKAKTSPCQASHAPRRHLDSSGERGQSSDTGAGSDLGQPSEPELEGSWEIGNLSFGIGDSCPRSEFQWDCWRARILEDVAV
jgi:hypothetical protein